MFLAEHLYIRTSPCWKGGSRKHLALCELLHSSRREYGSKPELHPGGRILPYGFSPEDNNQDQIFSPRRAKTHCGIWDPHWGKKRLTQPERRRNRVQKHDFSVKA